MCSLFIETNLYRGCETFQMTSAEEKAERKKLKKHEMLKRKTNIEENDTSKKSKKDSESKFKEQTPAKEDTDSEQIKVVGFDDLMAYSDFSGPKFSKILKPLFEGLSKPTPIQSYCWPSIQTGRDVIGIAETGSGKTLAFSLPSLDAVLSKGSVEDKGIKIVVIAPTRELALQTHNVLCKAVASVCIYGGVSKDDQRKELKKLKPIVIIGTPGRLVDFLEDGTLNFGHVSHFVLDEADRMLDLGFADDVSKIVSKLPKEHQTIMFSATWPMDIQTMAGKYLKPNPIKIVIGDREAGENKACSRIKQIVEVIRNPHERDNRLLQLLKQYHSNRTNRVIIFVLYKKEAARIEHYLNRNGWKASSIHGDKPQHERTKCMDAFRAGTDPLLVATDVAARGLDIPNVEYVINYTFPLTIEDYIHRIGRTGRGGKEGIAHTLFTDNDKAHAGELVSVLRTAGIEIPKDLLVYDCSTKKKVHKLYGAFYKEADPNAECSRITFSDDDD